MLLVFASVAQAASGVAEINQTCAVETGCFAGDAAGFPVTITQPGSYRLTSNLSIATDVTGIEISSSYVTLDLGGFEIAGPGSCTGTAAALSCGPIGVADGVSALASARHVTIRNGTVRNMSRDGIGIEADGTVENIFARHNARHGIGSVESVHVTDSSAIENGDDGFDLDEGSIVDGCTAKGNFQHGIEIDDDGGVVYGTVSRGNGARGFNIVAGSRFGKDNLSSGNGAEDSCGGRFCSARKRFYVGGSFEYGTLVPSSFCDPGFRLLREFELFDGHLARYEGELTSSIVQLSNSRLEITDGGGVGVLGAFECLDANDINGSESGFRCSNSNVRELTSGWHRPLPPQVTVFSPTICVEE
jgi:hypothetical protein